MKASLKSLVIGASALLAIGASTFLSALPAWAKPIPDSYRVTVNGVTWAQPALFAHTWGDINAQCPDGVCGGTLGPNEWDMTGWTWAGPEEAAALFNFYLANAGVTGSDLLDPADLDDAYIELGRADWVNAILTDFRITHYDHLGGLFLTGYVAEFPGEQYRIDASYRYHPDVYTSTAQSRSGALPDRRDAAWFFCTDACPASAVVPVPPVLTLICLGLALLIADRIQHGLRRAGRRQAPIPSLLENTLVQASD